MVGILKAEDAAIDNAAINEKLKSVYKYKDINMTTPGDEAACQEWFMDVTGGRTVPRVFLDGKCVGGASEVEALRGSGKLEEILKGILQK